MRGGPYTIGVADSPLPSPEYVAELARRGEAIRAEAARLVEDALRAIAGDPARGPAAARDVAAYLARRPAGGRGEPVQP